MRPTFFPNALLRCLQHVLLRTSFASSLAPLNSRQNKRSSINLVSCPGDEGCTTIAHVRNFNVAQLAQLQDTQATLGGYQSKVQSLFPARMR